MIKIYSFIRLPIMAILYLVTYFIISFSASNNLNLLNYFDIESDFDFWSDSYLLLANTVCLLISIVIIIMWTVLHNSKVKKSHRLTEIMFGRFLIFFFLQLLVCVAFCIFVKGPEDIFLFYPMLYLVPFINSTIFFSTYLVSGTVVPGSRELWFKVISGIISMGSYVLIFYI